LTKDLDRKISPVIETKRGKDSETWAGSEIAIDFAEWLSPEFSSFVKQIFIRYLKGDRARRDKTIRVPISPLARNSPVGI
jgi:hypothetical protein